MWMTKADIATVLAVGSFLLSIITLWLTQFRRGHLKMTRPSLIVLIREMPSCTPKIFLRTLLYSSAIKGCVVENMFLRVHQSFGAYRFDFWGYGEFEKLTHGSGLYVGQTGIAYNHHFTLARGSGEFVFWSGEYRMEVFATEARQKRPEKIMEVAFSVDGDQSAEFTQINDRAIWLEWDPDTLKYAGHIEVPTKGVPLQVAPRL
jgi:hypothetical protein